MILILYNRALWFLVLVAALDFGKAYGLSAASTSGSLDYVIIQVNGHRRSLHPGDSLVVVRGDFVMVEEAYLSDQTRPANVKVVGFVPRRAARVAEDRGFVIDSARDLQRSWSLGGDGRRYEVKVYSGAAHHGSVFIELASPELHYVLVSVNEELQVARPDQLLRLSGDDVFKVERIVSNVNDEQNPLALEMRPLASDLDLPGVRFFEMIFFRDRELVARVPVQVEGL